MEQEEKYYRIAELISRFIGGNLSPAEQEELYAWMKEDDLNYKLLRKIAGDGYVQNRLERWREDPDDAEWERLMSRLRLSGRKRGRVRFLKYAKYAAVFIVVVMIACFASIHRLSRKPPALQLLRKDFAERVDGSKVHAGRQFARLVLSNGHTIALKDSSRLSLVDKGRSLQDSAGLPAEKNGNRSGYDYIITPKGGEYRIVLEDGTKVWLNAATTLKFPAHFSGNTREVYLTGEAYFEVKHDPGHPFIVHTEDMSIKALGTKFNVQAYPEEAVHQSALIEGLVAVTSAYNGLPGGTAILHPGDGLVTDREGAEATIGSIDPEEVLSWKNGLFVFDNEPIGSIMHKLSRWYNVEVAYENIGENSFHLTGRIEKYENIKGVLKLLEMTGKVRFVLRGNHLMVAAYLPENKNQEKE